jgi:hypothetical protein
MARYELCVNSETPGGGVRYDGLEDAKLAGWREVGEAVDEVPAASFPGAFFLVYEVGAGASPAVVIFDSRNDAPDG